MLLNICTSTSRQGRGVCYDLVKAAWPNEDLAAFLHEWEELDIAEPHPTFPGVKKALEELGRHYELSIPNFQMAR